MSEELAAPETGAETAVVVPTEPTQPAGEAQQPAAEGAEPAGDPPQPDNKGKERLSMRFSELTAQRDAERARATAAEAELERLRQPAEPEPYDGEANEPVTAAQIAAEVKRVLAEERQNAAHQDAQNAQQARTSELQRKLFASELPGAVLVASGDNTVPFTLPMINALADSEQAALVADHLGRNPQEAAKIAALPPERIGYELAKLEGRLASQPKTTNAPEPPSQVGARGAPATGLRDDLPIADWMRIDAEKSAKRR